MATRYKTKGATLEFENAAGAAFVKPVQLVRFGGLTFDSEEVDETIMEDLVRYTVQGLRDLGECPFVYLFDPDDTTHFDAGDDNIIELSKSGEHREFKITLPTTPVYTLVFNGWIKSLELPEFNVSDPMTLGGAIRIVSDFTLAEVV
jgi:hypothetical protein